MSTTATRPPLRSWLYAPAMWPKLVEKALAGEADAVICDLEDAVPPAHKDDARAHAGRLLASQVDKPLFVRVNAPASPWFEADLELIADGGSSLAGVHIAKCQSVGDVQRVAERLSPDEAVEVHCLLESALAVERAYDIATSSPRVGGIALGEADVRASLAVHCDNALAYARSRVVTAARAAGLPSPVQSVYTQLHDPEGLRRSTMTGRDQGFFGRTAIHPQQVPIINEVFTPTEGEVTQARELLANLNAELDAGRAAFVTQDGQFVDPAVVDSARQVLALAPSAPSPAPTFAEETG